MDLERAQEIRSSGIWADILKYIDEHKIKSLEMKLRHCPPDQLIDIQTRIQVWEEMKSLPTDVIESLE
jgi:hypothetical protein